MNQRDKTILNKISDYCLEIKETHDFSNGIKNFSRMKNMVLYTGMLLKTKRKPFSLRLTFPQFPICRPS